MDPTTLRPAVRESPPAPPSRRLRRRALPVTAAAVGVFGVLTAVTWATGGLRAQSDGPAKPVRSGATVDQGRFTVKVLSARTQTIKLLTEVKPVPALIVRMRVTNIGDDTVMMASPSFGFEAGVRLRTPNRNPDDVLGDAAKGTPMALQPRLPQDVDVIWKWAGSPPRQITLDLYRWTYRQSFDRDEYYWSTDKKAPIAARVVLPVPSGGGG